MPQEQLDQDAVRLAKAIRYTESRDNENAKGASGEFGLYQWMPQTWASTTKKYNLDPNDTSRENQNRAAYSQIKELKDQGFKPSQIAAFWNSGKTDGWENLRGYNSKGVKYDVPDYVKKVGSAYNSLKTNSVPKLETTLSTVGATQMKPPEPTKVPVSNKIANFLGFEKTVDTLGSIAARMGATEEEKAYLSKPTGKDIAGATLNIGATAIPIGAAEKVGLTTLERFVGPKVAKVASQIGVGALTGATLDVAKDLEEGRPIKLGTETVVGAAIPGISTLLGHVRAPSTGGRVVNSLIKPLTKNFSYGKNPGRAVAELGITANSLEDLERKIFESRSAVGQNISKLSKEVPQTVRINVTDSLGSFDEALRSAIKKNDQALFNRLNEAKVAITNIMSVQDGRITPVGSRVLDNLSYDEALEVKRIIGDLTKWTGQRTEDETVNGALTRAYGSLKNQMNKAAESADPKIASELKKLNEQYADLTSAQIATKYRDVLESRHNLIDLPGKIGITTGLITAPFTGGVTTVLSAIGSIGLSKALASTTFKTQLAKWLARAPQKEKDILFRAYPNLLRMLQDSGVED